MAVLKLPDVEIHYAVSGGGKTLVLIPGFASGAWSWVWQTEDFSRDFQVITFDPRGISQSKLDDGTEASIQLIAKDVVSLLDHLNIDNAHVLGISFGGFSAQEFALVYP